MATRVGEGGFIPPPGLGGDNRLDQQREQALKQLLDMQLVSNRNQGENVLASVVRTLQKMRPEPGAAAGTGGGLKVAPLNPEGAEARRAGDDRGRQQAELPKLVADFQRQNGLPVTGKFDQQTISTMKDLGVIPPPTPSTSSPSPGATGPSKAPPKPEDTAAARLVRSAVDQQGKARVDPTKKEQPIPAPVSAKDAAQQQQPQVQADRVVDPSKLLASLFTAGFVGKRGNLEDAMKSFQATFGLPINGKLDAATMERLQTQGLVETEPKKTTSDKPVEAKQQVRRALNESPTSKTAADKDVNRDPIRPQASTQKPTTSADVAARAPSTASSDAADKARLDTVLAQQAATERGVQEATGDPHATQGHGEVAGEGAGQKGAGGASGGGAVNATGPGAAAPADDAAEVGDETAVGNTKAGDDVFVDDDRGNANVKGDGPEGDGSHWSVPPLSEQVMAALEKIARDDDGTGPVTYTWDVTFYRPGVYASGQPAEELWHIAVNKADAFDSVWQTAASAIALKMLYAEPEATPPTIEDFVLALRRARVR